MECILMQMINVGEGGGSANIAIYEVEVLANPESLSQFYNIKPLDN
jgi:ribosome-associated protein YbcJ (S4-like RNA binding protein)